jgi:hypothetical protein
MSENFRELPNLACDKCHTIMSHGVDLQNKKLLVRKNDIFVCSICGQINILGDANLRCMTVEEVNALDRQSQLQLGIAVAAVQTALDDHAGKKITSVNGVR